MSEMAGVSDLICSRCGFMIPPGEAPIADGLCRTCGGSKAAAGGAAGAPRLPLAFAGGAIGASIGAGVWTAIAIISNAELGVIALLVGFLAGQGVKIGAGGLTGRHLRVTATTFALAGLVLAKYLTFAHFFAEAVAEEGLNLGPFAPEIIAAFPAAMTEMLSPYDLLWVILAMSTAWKAPAAEPSAPTAS